MWKYRARLLILLIGFYVCNFRLSAQTEQAMSEPTEQEADSVIVSKKIIEIGLAFDYLKLHTLALDESEKWEAALNVTFLDKYALIAAFGLAALSPEDAYENATYLSDGEYLRLGIDYQTYLNPSNLIMLGIRYSVAQYDEYIDFRSTNPLFEAQTGNITRESLEASWLELVLTSEKVIKRILKKEIKDFLAIGFKARLKGNLSNSQFNFVETKYIPGYGGTVNRLNPEINLYLKFRIPLLKN